LPQVSAQSKVVNQSGAFNSLYTFKSTLIIAFSLTEKQQKSHSQTMESIYENLKLEQFTSKVIGGEGKKRISVNPIFHGWIKWMFDII
jgi:hypothetical protein